MKPPIVTANNTINTSLNTLSFEKAQFTNLFNPIWSNGKEYAQEVANVMHVSQDEGQTSISFQSMCAFSRIQAVTHNVCLAIFNNPSVLAIPEVQTLLDVTTALRGIDKSLIPKDIDDTLAYDVIFNADGTTTIEDLPDEEVEE